MGDTKNHQPGETANIEAIEPQSANEPMTAPKFDAPRLKLAVCQDPDTGSPMLYDITTGRVVTYQQRLTVHGRNFGTGESEVENEEPDDLEVSVLRVITDRRLLNDDPHSE